MDAITGKITNLDGDKIEITTYPEKEVIFLDFAYKGLPEDLPIEKIQIRRAPEISLQVGEETAIGMTEAEDTELAELEKKRMELERNLLEMPEEEDDELAQMEKRRLQIQQELLEIPEDELVDATMEVAARKKIEEEIRTVIFNADQIKFGEEDLEAITQYVDVPEEEQRYDINKQLDDLLDDMLSTIPNAQRTDTVKNNIHQMIQRFQQLRDTFSIFDDKGYALMPKEQGANYKPLVGVMEKLDKQLYWLLPVVQTQKKIYEDDEGEGEEGMGEGEVMGEGKGESAERETLEYDYTSLNFDEEIAKEKIIQERFEQNDTDNETNRYIFLQKELNDYYTPFTKLPPGANRKGSDDILTAQKVNTTITALVDNLTNFNSSVNGNNTYAKMNQKYPVRRKRFAMQTFTTGTTGLEMTKMRGENPIIKRKNLTPNETMAVKALVTLPEPTVRFARVNLMTTTLLEKANLNLHFFNYWQLLREKTHVAKTTLTDLSQPYNHEEERFLKDVKHFAVSSEVMREDADTYNKFLEAVIPKTKFLFNLIKPYLVGKLSIADILTYLEPFMVYQADLTFMQYKEMNDYIQEKILEYRKNYATKAREYGNMKGTQLVALPSLIKLLDENPNMRTKVLDVYGFTDTIMQMTNADFIKHILAADNGVFYNNAIALLSTGLMIGNGTQDMTDISMYLNAATIDAAVATKGKTKGRTTAKTAALAAATNPDINFGEQAACNKITVIAKRYIETDEMQEDNGKEDIYFDKNNINMYMETILWRT